MFGFDSSKIKSIVNDNSRSAKVTKNAAGSLLIKGVSVIIQLILVPLCVDYLSPEIYGIWLTLSSVIVWLNFFDIGFTLGLKNRLTQALAEKNYEKAKSLVSTTYVMMLLIFIPLLIIFEILVPRIHWTHILNVSSSYELEIRNIMFVLVGCFCIQMIVSVITSVVAAFQKVALSSAFGVIANFLALVSIIILSKVSTPSLLNLACVFAAMPILVMVVASIILYKGSMNVVSPAFNKFNKKFVGDIFSLGIKFFILQFQVVILYQTTNILITNVSSPLDVTEYNIAYKYLSIAEMLFIIILGPLWPAFTDAFTKKDYEWMKRTYRLMSKIFLCVFAFMLILIAFSPAAYRILSNSKVAVSWMMTFAVGIYLILLCWCSFQTYILNGIGIVKIETICAVAGLLLQVPMAISLGRSFGAVGVILSLIIIHIVFAIIYTIQTRKILNQKVLGIWGK